MVQKEIHHLTCLMGKSSWTVSEFVLSFCSSLFSVAVNSYMYLSFCDLQLSISGIMKLLDTNLVLKVGNKTCQSKIE